MQKYNNRSEVPEKYKWDLTPFFKNEEEFNKTYEETVKKANELKNYVGCTKDAYKLYEFLNLQYETLALFEDLYVYAFLKDDEELGIEENVIRKNKAEKLGVIISNNISFFDSELLKLKQEEYTSLFNDNDTLNEYRALLDKIYREKEHVLSEREEQIINELTTAMNHFDDMSSNLLNNEHDYGKVKVDGENVVIATTNYRLLTKNKDENIRKRVYNLFNKKIEQYSVSNASYLNSYVQMNDKLAQIYYFKDSWEQKLFGLNLSDKVFKTLVKTTEDNLESLHKYFDLKREVLGFDKLKMYDLNLEMVASSKEYTIEEAQDLVREAIKPLGKEYAEKYEKIIDNHYIDYCQYKGKCSGGYSASSLKQDSRILLSFNGNLDSVSTIAHECGHNVHHQYSYENNPYQYRYVANLVAEVASLTNECLLSSYLVNNGKTKDEKLAGVANILEVITSNLFGAVREGKLEQEMYKEVHKGGAITKEFMDKKTKASLKKYYGSAVKVDKYAKNKWITRSHYYMHFYLYSYAICISVASAVASKILNGDKVMLNNYIEFLKSGSDKWPSEAFKILGVNLEDKSVYEEAIKYFDSLIDKFKEIYEGEVK